MRQEILKNGLRVVLVPYAGTEAATILVLVKVGSRYESAELSGASHFIEHMVFKGTKKRPTTLDISRALDAVGAEYNAYTGKDLTGYYVKAAAEHVPLAVEMLHDMIFHSKFSPTEMNRERRVIVEEINMYEDNPLLYVEDLLEQVMFDGNPLGWEIAGQRQTVREMKRADFLRYHGTYYAPSRIVVTVAGRIPDKTFRLLTRTFGSVPDGRQNPPSFSLFGELPSRRPPRVKIQVKPVEQIQVVFGFPGLPLGHREEPIIKILSLILGGTMSSRLFMAVRERRGLCYLIRSNTSGYEDIGLFMIQAGLDKARLPLAAKIIFQELRSVVKNGITRPELRRAKDHLRGQLPLHLEESSERANWYGKQFLFFGRAKTPEERLREFQKVTPQEVQAMAARIFDRRRLSLAAIGSFSSENSFLKELGL